MTYPSQPQQYAPQGYAPQVPPSPAYLQPQAYGQSAYPPAPPQGLTQSAPYPGPQHLQPPTGGQTLPTQAPQLGQSGRTGGGATAPAPRHLVGRTVIFEPIRIDETTTAKDSNGNMVSRPTAYYHLTVVDGGPLQYGDNRDHDISKQHGMTFEVQTPCRFTSVSSDRFGIVNEVRDAIARGDQASVGVVVQGTQGNRPFLVTKPGRDLDGKDRPDGDARFQAAMDVWDRIWNKDLSWNPTPRSLVAPPSQAPQQVSYQPTQAVPGATYGTAGGPQQYVQQVGYTPHGSVSGVQAHPEYAMVVTQPQQYPQPGSENGGAYGPYATPYGAANPGHGPFGDGPGPGYAVPQQQQQSAPPANPAFEAWLATLPPEQRAAFAQANAPQGGPGL